MSRKYAAMRPSDIPWLREIPEHWKVSPMRAVALPKQVRNTGMIESNLLSLSYGRIVRKDITTSDGLLPESFETYQIVDRDDVVFRFTDLQNDKRSLRSALVAERGIITSAYVAVRPKDVEPRFFAYVMRAWDLSKVFYGLGGGVRQSLKFADVARLPVLLPSPGEQRAIADFLDRETAQIDTLIAKQQRLIATLRERRTAVVSAVVRRGTRSDVPAIDSGVSWLGEIPAHWEVKRLKYSVASVVPGVWGGEPMGDENDIRCVRVADFDRQALRVNAEVPTVRSVPAADRQLRGLRPGDLLLEKSGGTALNPVGVVVMYEGPAEQAVCANFIARIRTVDGQDPRYWLYAHSASYATRMTQRSVKQTTGIQNLDQTSYFDERFPFPPLQEQREIAAYLDAQTSRIDTLIQKSERLIELSQERRAALITAAVTGQIDVRKAA